MNDGSSAENCPGTPFISVVIPLRDDLPGARRCVHALGKQSYPPERFEIILVDDGSHEPVHASDLEAPNIRVYRQPAAGSYAARNLGIQRSTGDLIAFTDSDCVPDPEWLQRAAATFERQPLTGAVAGCVQIVDRGSRASAAELYERKYAFPQAAYVRHEHFGVTANLIVRRHVVESVGLFDARLISGGDWEWGQRLHMADIHMEYAPDVVVEHPARTTLRGLLNKQRRVTHGLASLVRAQRHSPADVLHIWRTSMTPPLFEIIRILRDRRLGLMHKRPAVAGIRVLLWAHRIYLLAALRVWRGDAAGGGRDD